jgi:hypothetical protein
MEHKRCEDSSLSLVFFLIGVIATVAVRLVTVLIDVNPVYGKAAWYIGIIGFFIFFIYKFKTDHERSVIIRRRALITKMSREDKLEKEDRESLAAILCALSSSKDKINYFFIFSSSAVALALALYFDFIK